MTSATEIMAYFDFEIRLLLDSKTPVPPLQLPFAVISCI